MARFGVNEADNYGGQGGAGYFSLKNDKDVANVRFMYNGIDDIEGLAVHEVQINGKKRWVNCLRDYGKPVDDCPFCKAGRFVNAKYFLNIYNVDEDKVQVWERGKKFGAKLSSLCGRYPNLVSHTFDIERNGKPGDTQTTYEIFETGQDDTTLEDLPEAQDALGTIVLDKSYEDMQYYIDNECFPDDEDEAPVRRRGEASRSSRRATDDEPPFEEDTRRREPARGARRTPSRRGETF